MSLFCGRCQKPTCPRCTIKQTLPVVSPTPCETSSCASPSNVHICSLVIKKAEDVRKYHNSLVTVEEDGTTYWVDDDGVPVVTYRMPMYIDDFDPATKKVVSNAVYDFKNHKMYVFDPAGDYQIADLKEDK